jgi:hypothetical protein
MWFVAAFAGVVGCSLVIGLTLFWAYQRIHELWLGRAQPMPALNLGGPSVLSFPVDITMLAWPGWRGELARRRWVTRYGADDLVFYQSLATKRHQAWLERGCELRLVPSLRDPRDIPHTYVEAKCKEHGLHVDERGDCPRC